MTRPKEDVIHETLVALVGLLAVAATVGMFARRVRLPYTVALVIAGLALGLLQIRAFDGLHLTPDLLLALLLPPLLFEASFHLDWPRFRRDAWTTLALAGPGVFIATAVTAAVVYGLFVVLGISGLDAGAAALFGTIVAATDPVSVLALFKALRVDPRLYLLVEGESLLNDGVAVVVFLIVAGVLGVHVGHDAPHLETTADIALFGIRTFLWMAGLGAGIGALVGLAGSAITRAIDDHLVEVTLTVLVAWSSFLFAESVHASGVLACVVAGVVHGNVGGRVGMSPSTRIAVVDFWEVLAFFANTIVFLLIGLELDPIALAGSAVPIGLAWIAVLVGRVPVVGLGWLVARLRPGADPLPVSWMPVMLWGGLRGSLSMVLVIGLPLDYAARPLLLSLVFGVTGLTLLLQGLTMGPLLARLGLISATDEPIAAARARRLIATRALAEIERMALHGEIGPEAAETLRADYVARRDAAVVPPHSDVDEVRRHLLAVERDALDELGHEGLPAAVASELHHELAERRSRH